MSSKRDAGDRPRPPSKRVSTGPEEATEEEWQRRIESRRAMVEKGKNTIGYHRYVEQVPKHQRQREHLKTPDPTMRISKRRFEGQVRAWRRFLHRYDDKSDADGTEDFTADLAAEAEDAAEPQDKAQPAALAEVQQAEKKTKQQSDAAAFDSLNAVLKGEEELDAILDLI